MATSPRRRPARRAVALAPDHRALRGIAAQAQLRIPRADLDERDPDFIRERLPLMWLLASLWYRGEVRGLGNIPDTARCCWSATTPAAT